MTQTVSAIISGNVQGVFFRQSTRERGRALGITGTVENLSDGSVQIIASGTPEQLDALLLWCQKGPEKASVDSVHVEYIPAKTFTDFTIIR